VSDSPPIVTPEAVEAFLRGLPLSMDKAGFLRFAVGFPRRYLEATPPVEVVRHYALMQSLGPHNVVSSVSREEGLWKLSLVARDRRALFSRIAGALSCFELDIVSAEAFANANSLVLDLFHFADSQGRFREPAEGRRFQAFLEDVIEGRTDLEAELRKRPGALASQGGPLSVAWDDAAHPVASRLTLVGRDRRGLLYGVSRVLSEAGLNIEVAYIDTSGERIKDEFFLTRDGRRPTENEKAALTESLERLVSPRG
jgi:[protein-PII] uridylyltransferase